MTETRPAAARISTTAPNPVEDVIADFAQLGDAGAIEALARLGGEVAPTIIIQAPPIADPQ